MITGPPAHSLGVQTSNGRWRLSSSVTLPAGGRANAVTFRLVDTFLS